MPYCYRNYRTGSQDRRGVPRRTESGLLLLKEVSSTMWHSKFTLPLAALVLVSVFSHPAQSQTLDTQVTLSCNDGHSVIFTVNQTELTSLLADVHAINA